ncbi:MAG: hypothetical protein WC763_04765 [Candidatus Paceibacterota bacterium]|jgi:hypothetical protein
MANSRELQILLSLKDEASKKLKTFGEAAEKTFKVSLVAATAAGTAIAAFGVSSIKAFAESQAEMAKFEATMKSIPGATDKTRQALLSAASAVRKLGFGDEEASNAMAMFYQRTKSTTEAIKLNTIAMDLARAKNIGLSDAANLVNQVLSGNGKVLKQYGIDLKDSATPLEALGELHSKVQGQASAFATTLQGRMMRLSETFGDLKEKIGEALSDLGAGGILERAISLLESIEKIDFKATFSGWRDSIGDFITKFDELTHTSEFFMQLWATVTEFFNTYLKPSWDGFVQTLIDNKEVLLTLLANFTKFLGVISAGALIAALTVLTTMFEGLGLAIKGVKWFVESLAEAFRDVATWVDKAFSSLSKFANKFGLSSLSKALSGIGGSVSNFLGGARVDDAIISPDGKIITTHPDDYLIATKDPHSLAGNGGGVTINVYGDVSGQDLIDKVKRALAMDIKYQVRV